MTSCSTARWRPRSPASKTTSTDPGHIRRRVVVHGRVQGVFFRDTMRRQASERGVAGWVRNRPDGTLEAVLEGSPEAVDALVRFAHEGPRGADVEAVEVSEEDPEGLAGFEVS